MAPLLIREFARSDYLVAKGFAQFLAYLISRVADARVRILLVENLWEEHGSGDPSEIHFELYKRLLMTLDVKEPVLQDGVRAPFLQLHYDIADASIPAGVAVFCYANEFLSMLEFSKVRRACVKYFPGVDQRYFDVNQDADVQHTKKLEESLSTLVPTASVEERAYAFCEDALVLRANFYDEIITAVTETESKSGTKRQGE